MRNVPVAEAPPRARTVRRTRPVAGRRRGGAAARADGPLPLAGDLEAAVRREMVVVRPAAEEDLAVGLAAHFDREGGAFAFGSGPFPGEADLRGNLAPVAQRAAERFVRVGVHALLARHQDVAALRLVEERHDRILRGFDETRRRGRSGEGARGKDEREEQREECGAFHGSE